MRADAFVIRKTNFEGMAAYTLTGFPSALETLCIIFGAIPNTLKRSGAMAAINRMFNGITPDIRIKAVNRLRVRRCNTYGR